MNHIFKITFSLILLIFVNSCTYSQNANAPSRDCIALNNQGVEYISNYPMNGKSGINQAIDLLQQAIQCDSTYLTAYINIANAYDKNHNYDGEMRAYNKILKLTNYDSPSIITQKGVLFEKINKIDSAKKYYDIAKIACKKKLIKHPEDAEIIKELILLKALIIGKDEALKEIDEQIKLHPGLQEKLSGEYEYYKIFDRHAYIYDLPIEK